MSATEPDLLDVLLDPTNTDPILLGDDSGRQIAFKQLAVIPHTVGEEKRLYAILSPLDPIKGLDDNPAIVFRVDTDSEGNFRVNAEEDDAAAKAVFDKFIEMLKECGEN